MEALRKFNCTSEEELWQQVALDIARDKNLTSYSAQLNLNDTEVFLDIDIDLGGGFESGFSTTTFMAPLLSPSTFQFVLHEQDWMSEIGKFFGMDDVTLGYPELDEAFVVKTNQPETLQALFADEHLRHALLQHPNCELKLGTESDDADAPPFITFSKDEAILDMTKLQEVYRMVITIVQKLAGPVV
ncbi:hypothetical protein [Rufibacter sp. LB8]|uniref:hypothetical protein n=1 Tax=Rufibacter sp. LB8 TaxID=2777781 RepID=UPI00178C656B|nr:hypothetical protein [Rufibacter sp. LB8]